MAALHDMLEIDAAALRRWEAYARAIGAASPARWAEDAILSGLEPEAVAWRVSEGVRRLLAQLTATRRGGTREAVLLELEAGVQRLRVLLGDG